MATCEHGDVCEFFLGELRPFVHMQAFNTNIYGFDVQSKVDKQISMHSQPPLRPCPPIYAFNTVS